MAYKICVFSLNQWALDFAGNTTRIIKSIDAAKEAKAIYRVGPELELCGYSLEDAFYENDTVFHSWTSLLKILDHSKDIDLIIDIGLPIHHSALYNCRVIAYRGKILCIRAKTSLACEGNYREYRHFKAWDIKSGIVPYKLPSFVIDKLDQEYVPFGANFILEISDPQQSRSLKIGWEICQELWDAKNVSSELYQDFSCHLIVNSSGSYWELRKLNIVTDMIKDMSLRGNGCYALSNLVGCDGQRYVFYGRSCIFENGNLVSMTPVGVGLFEEIQMISHLIWPGQIDEHRSQNGIKPRTSAESARIFKLNDFSYQNPNIVSTGPTIFHLQLVLSSPKVRYNSKKFDLDPRGDLRFEREIQLYVPLWLWDYLRRSKMKGFMMPLSGGLDSSSVAILVFCMCNHLYKLLDESHVIKYFEEVHGIARADLHSELSSPRAICQLLLKCSYLSTNYSSSATRRRANSLCKAIGAEFSEISIQDVYTSFRSSLTSRKATEEISLLDQNLQARLRMTATYYLSGGNRIVLATGNVDEAIVGYLTKYDCSSADINPIGGLCKADLKSFLSFCCSDLFKSNRDFVDVVKEIIDAPPSAELTGSEQRDEEEIGLTYDEISILGKIRRGLYGCSGPKSAFEFLWFNRFDPPFNRKIRCLSQSNSNPVDIAYQLAKLVIRFYSRYAKNRHKLTILTPALHAETYSPDDNRFDHRQFLYAPWSEQEESIDKLIEEIREHGDLY